LCFDIVVLSVTIVSQQVNGLKMRLTARDLPQAQKGNSYLFEAKDIMI
jgi:hypothetical protein